MTLFYFRLTKDNLLDCLEVVSTNTNCVEGIQCVIDNANEKAKEENEEVNERANEGANERANERANQKEEYKEKEKDRKKDARNDEMYKERTMVVSNIKELKDIQQTAQLGTGLVDIAFSLDLILEIVKYNKSTRSNKERKWLHTYLSGSEIYIPEFRKPHTSVSEREQVKKLRKETEIQLKQYEYFCMTSNLSSEKQRPSKARRQMMEHWPKKVAGISVENNRSSVNDTLVHNTGSIFRATDSIGYTTNEDDEYISQSITAVINILLSAIGVGIAVFVISRTAMETIGYRVLLSMLSSIVVASSEVYLYVLYIKK